MGAVRACAIARLRAVLSRLPCLGVLAYAPAGQIGLIPAMMLDTVDKMLTAPAQGLALARCSGFQSQPDAPRAVQADDRPVYRKEAAEDG